MSSQKPSLPKGTRDFGPAEVQKRRYILNTIESVFKKYGFMSIETPAMENLSTLEGKYGDEGDQLLFRVINSGNYLKELIAYNDQLMADESQDKTFLPSYSGKLNDLDYKAALPFITEKGLRYDLTVPFARYVVMNRNDITFPFRRYQMQPVWRADRPQKGRYREFWQCDADVVGSDSLLNETDLILIYDEAFRNLGIKHYELRINNRKILSGISEYVGATKEQYNDLLTITLDKLDKIGEEGVRKELTQSQFSENEIQRVFDLINISGDNNAKLSQLRDLLKASLTGSKGIEELAFILASINSSTAHPVNLKIDFSLARGLSYYTGCIFEVVSTEGSLKSSIGGGGRYDNLTGIFGLPNVSGVGISFGLDRIYDVMEELNLFPGDLKATGTKVLFCCFDQPAQEYALGCLKKCRSEGIASELYPDLKKIGKQLDYANFLGIPYAVIIGENETKSGLLMLKNLAEGTQEELPVEAIIAKLKN